MVKKGSNASTTTVQAPGAEGQGEKKVSLYAAEQLLQQLEVAMESDEALSDEQLARLADQYLEASHNAQAAIERYLHLIQKREERAAVRRSEGKVWRAKADGLSKLATTDENLSKQLRRRLLAFMDGRDVKKLSLDLFEVITKNGRASLTVDQEMLPDLEYLAEHYPQLLSIELDDAKLREWLEAGNTALNQEQQPFASLQRGRVLQIKPSVRPD